MYNRPPSEIDFASRGLDAKVLILRTVNIKVVILSPFLHYFTHLRCGNLHEYFSSYKAF
jgi:hypothetical protein